MSQNSLTLPTTGTVSGLQMTQDINNALDTLNTLASGPSAPSSPEAGQVWHDTANNIIKLRSLDNTTWIPLFTLNESDYAAAPANQQLGGFVNRFRNGTFDVAQRGTSGSVGAGTSAYMLDGWIGTATGAALGWGRGTNTNQNILNLTCTTGLTSAIIEQRIESSMCFPLAGATVTVQWQITNETGASFTPTLIVKHAGAADNWTSPTTDLSVSLQACPNGATTVLAYTFTASASAGNGLDIQLNLGGALNQTAGTGVQVQIGQADIRLTPGVAAGLNSSPPAPERRPIQVELALCQRYLFQLNAVSNQVIGFGWGNAANTAEIGIPFPVAMRAIPTFLPPSTASNVQANFNNGTSVASSTGNTTTANMASIQIGVASGIAAASGCAARWKSSVGTDAMTWSAEL